MIWDNFVWWFWMILEEFSWNLCFFVPSRRRSQLSRLILQGSAVCICFNVWGFCGIKSLVVVGDMRSLCVHIDIHIYIYILYMLCIYIYTYYTCYVYIYIYTCILDMIQSFYKCQWNHVAIQCHTCSDIFKNVGRISVCLTSCLVNGRPSSGSRRMTSTRNTGSSPAHSSQPEAGDFTTNFAPRGEVFLYMSLLLVLLDADESCFTDLFLGFLRKVKNDLSSTCFCCLG